MNLTFLGTGAADFGAELETVYRDAFSKDIRRSSALLVNGTILVDCGPHTLHAMEIAGQPQAAEVTSICCKSGPPNVRLLTWAAGRGIFAVSRPLASRQRRQLPPQQAVQTWPQLSTVMPSGTASSGVCSVKNGCGSAKLPCAVL